eukprot:gene13506-13631_t
MAPLMTAGLGVGRFLVCDGDLLQQGLPYSVLDPQMRMPRVTERSWPGIERHAVQNGGWAVELTAGNLGVLCRAVCDSAEPAWWHAASNMELTVMAFNRPVKLGRGLVDALELAWQQISDGAGEGPCEGAAADVQRKGGWVMLACEGLRALSLVRQGSRGTGRLGVRSEVKVAGLNDDVVSTWLCRLRLPLGEMPNPRRKRRQRGQLGSG